MSPMRNYIAISTSYCVLTLCDGALRTMKVGLALCIVGSDISEESRYHFNRPSRDAKSTIKRNPSNTSPLDHARRAAEKSEVTVVGDVENCDVIIVDDLISSGGTVVTRARQVCCGIVGIV